ncbi:MAG TPA: DUF4058 family protein [Pirellulales bacterium]|nr:DUF4058 family protein [Pirellulales bacterium]
MNSPFPGMDPYLEQHWLDVHQRLVIYGCDQIQTSLPHDLLARVEERLVVEPDDSPARGIRADVRVVEQKAPPAVPQAAGVAVAEDVEAPALIDLSDEPITEGFIKIVDATAEKVVTVIEILSMSNKLPGEGQRLYRQKQQELNEGGVSLVEIDLLRAGEHVLNVPSRRIPRAYRTPYRVCVRRGWRPRRVELYRAPLEKRLPKIQIPLRETDKDVTLDLQSLIELCYRNGRYDRTDYTVDPDPPFDPPTAAWANELLKAKGLR